MKQQISGIALLWSLASCAGGPPAQEVLSLAKIEQRCTGEPVRHAVLSVGFTVSVREELAERLQKGPVFVRAEHSCALEIIRDCESAGKYTYNALDKVQNKVKMSHISDLYSYAPMHESDIDQRIAQGSQLELESAFVGTLTLNETKIERRMLRGQSCAKATHVIVRLAVGAFRWLEYSRTGETSTVSALGDMNACNKASIGDIQAPLLCDHVVRVELMRLYAFP